MEVVRFTDLARSYAGRDVFTGLGGVIRAGEKIGIVGPNGAGKSSLVRILAGVDASEGGRLVFARESHLGYLAQTAAESGPQTLRAAFDLALADGRAMEWQMRATLDRFRFAESDLERSLSSFSGGQRTRALLARTLLEEPDWLILDEPTNHLDLETVRWLENFVSRDPRTFVIVSHDRYFLETLCTQIWELDRGELAAFDVRPGRAYTMYLAERDARREQQARNAASAAAERKRREAVVAELRTHGSHNYSAVRSREIALAKMDVVDGPRREKKKINVALGAARRATSGFAVEIAGLAKAYDHPLFSEVEMQFARGERVAIVGPNGAGKTTFLRILRGDLAPDRGGVRYGTGLSTASYSQSSVDDLPAGVSAADAVAQTGVTAEEARNLLGRLNLGGDSGDKPVEAFSGGERRRIMLARLMAQRADCLFLDEPTNDLDIPSREALEDVLAEYDGALFVVSHDRYLLKRLGDRVIEIRDGVARLYVDGYDAWERAEHERAASAARSENEKRDKKKREPKAHGERGRPHVEPAPPRETGSHRAEKAARSEARAELGRLNREAAQAEKRVADLERLRVDLDLEFAAPDLYDDPERVVALQRRADDLRVEIERAMHFWETATARVEALAP